MRVCSLFRHVFLLVVAVFVAGCQTVSNSSDKTTDRDAVPNGDITPRHFELVSTDIVSAMIQVRELNPLTTTMQYSRPSNIFGQMLIEKLQSAGYGMQEVQVDKGAFYINYQSRSIQTNAGDIQDFVVDVAGIDIRREYNVADGSVFPASLMYVSGTQSLGNIILNENIFLQQDKNLQFDSGVELELQDSRIITSETREIGSTGTRAVGGQDAILEARNNLLGRSNEDILSQKSKYNNLQRALLRFEDKSLLVGRKNKAVVKRVLDNFEEKTDALFLTSCGGDSGTQSEAARRSERIKEELVLNRVPVELIVEEGCVVDQYPDQSVVPRTVVLMHSRIDESRALVASKAPLEFPNKPLAMTIPYGAGGATDYQARIVTMVASEEKHLGQPILIVNKPGQGGRAGWSWFAETATDSGYDIASYNVPHFIAQSIKFSTSYNIDTLEPIANWGADPAVLVVPKNSRFRTVADLVRFARSNPKQLTVSGAGKFVGHHIALLQMEKAANIKTNYISDKGGAAALQQVVDGDVMAGFNNMSDAFRRSSEVRILAIADLERNEVLPEVQTFLELGMNVDDSSVNYRGIMVPKGTPQPVIDQLSKTIINMFEDSVVRERMQESGAPLRIMGREEVLSMWNERQDNLSILLRGL